MKIFKTTLVAFAFLASSPAFAAAGEGNRGDSAAENRRREAEQAARAPALNAQANAKYQKQLGQVADGIYNNLSAEHKTKVDSIILEAQAGEGVSINRSQLMGFVDFVTKNTGASCSIKNLTGEESKNIYSPVKAPKNIVALQGMRVAVQKKSSTSAAGGPGLLCSMGDKKIAFKGVPANIVNKYYNNNILLANEESTPDSDTGSGTNPASQQVTGYMTQSMSDLRAPASTSNNGELFYSSSSVQSEPKKEEKKDSGEMHFSNSAK